MAEELEAWSKTLASDVERERYFRLVRVKLLLEESELVRAPNEMTPAVLATYLATATGVAALAMMAPYLWGKVKGGKGEGAKGP